MDDPSEILRVILPTFEVGEVIDESVAELGAWPQESKLRVETAEEEASLHPKSSLLQPLSVTGEETLGSPTSVEIERLEKRRDFADDGKLGC